MSMYIGNEKIGNAYLVSNPSNDKFSKITNVLDLGIVVNENTEAIRASNSSILKEQIDKYYDGSMCFYFPIGQYYFDLIEIENNTKAYNIVLLGETRGNRLNNLTNNTNDRVIIYTNGTDGFINRTAIEGNNEVRFTVSHISFSQPGGIFTKPLGMCLGCTTNLGKEHNITLNDVSFTGYEYGFYSPGYTCYSPDNYFIICTHCKYGIYIGGASHMFRINHLELNFCKFGLRMDVGGTPCSVHDVHVAVGNFNTMQDYYDETPLMYGIHCKSGLVIDGIYYEQYAEDLPIDNFYLIHYEGFGNGNCRKVIVKNAGIDNTGAGNKGYFFYGRKYVGQGPENSASSMEVSDYYTSSYFSNGCVEFENCLTYDINVAPLLKRAFDVSDNSNWGIGYRIDGIDIYKEGMVCSKYYRRKFKTPLNNLLFIPEPSSTSLIAQYSYNSIPDDNLTYDGITISKSPVVDIPNKIGVHYKGRITIEGLTSETTNVILGIVGNVVGEDTPKFLVRELVKINSDMIGKNIVVDVDEFIPKTEATNLFFGYKCINSTDEKITDSDTSKIVYEIESIIDEVEYSKDVGVSRSRAYFKI